jgi:hypothetical protein
MPAFKLATASIINVYIGFQFHVMLVGNQNPVCSNYGCCPNPRFCRVISSSDDDQSAAALLSPPMQGRLIFHSVTHDKPLLCFHCVSRVVGDLASRLLQFFLRAPLQRLQVSLGWVSCLWLCCR